MSTTTKATSIREAIGYLVFRAVDIGDGSSAAALEVADQILVELGATPSTYALPAEPPESVSELWSSPHGTHWTRSTLRGTWVSDSGGSMRWWEMLIGAEWLSTVPPEPATGSEGEPDA